MDMVATVQGKYIVFNKWPTVNNKKGELLLYRGDGIPLLIHFNTCLILEKLSHFSSLMYERMFAIN